MNPFLLVVMDHDKREFAVEGPMLDDTPWINAVVAAQVRGKNIRCFVPGPKKTRYDVVSDIKDRFHYAEVGVVLEPKSG